MTTLFRNILIRSLGLLKIEISQHNASKFDTFLEYEKATSLFRFSKKSYVCFRVPKNIANFQGYCKPKYYLCYAKSKLSSASR